MIFIFVAFLTCSIIKEISPQLNEDETCQFDIFDSNQLEQKQIRITLEFSDFNGIAPGTKWCGAGNISKHYHDLGKYRKTDMCCRGHDHCPDVILKNSTSLKYGLTNNSSYSRLSCDCDCKFFKCLKLAAEEEFYANTIGYVYFTFLNTQCMRKYYPIIGCEKNVGVWFTRCAKYNFNKNGEKRYEWFDLPMF